MRVRHIAILVAVVGLIVTVGCVSENDNDHTPIPPGPTETVDRVDVTLMLIHEYDPGTVEGMPMAYSEQMMNETIDQHPELTERIREEFNTTTTQATFHRLQQTQQIHVTEQSNGTYEFMVRDGNACTTTIINGTYTPSTDTITENDRSTETQPC